MTYMELLTNLQVNIRRGVLGQKNICSQINSLPKEKNLTRSGF